LIEEVTAGNNKVIADLLPYGIGAVLEYLKEAPREEIYL
jgi:hypothetical protein